MSEKTAEAPKKASRRSSVIPKKAIPYVVALASVLTFLGAELSTDVPWTPARYMATTAAILTMLVGGGVAMRRW